METGGVTMRRSCTRSLWERSLQMTPLFVLTIEFVKPIRRKTMRKLLVAAGVLAFSFSTARRAAAPPIRIGATLSETGVAAFLGDPEIKTLQLYVEKINASGGIIGRKIQLVSYDDAGDPTKANSNVKRLIEEDKVDLIIGGTTSGTTMAMIP